MTQEALKLALDALKKCHYYMIDAGLPNQSLLNEVFTASTAIKEALAQHDSVQAKPEPEQEPVKWSDYELDGVHHNKPEPVGQLLEDAFGRGQVMWFNKPKDESMLYTTPPQRTWVGLTEEEVGLIADDYSTLQGAIGAIEAKLKQKNGYAEEKNT